MQLNFQTNNQTIYLHELTMNNKDVLLSKNAEIMFDLINKAQFSTLYEKRKFTREFYNNLFFFKTIDYGIGAYSNFIPLRMYQSQSYFQNKRLQNFKDKKIAFIQNELSNTGFNLSTVDIEKNFKDYYKIANDFYKKKDKKEILKFIKTKIKENKNLQEQFKNELLNPEYFLKLKNDDRLLKKVYKNVCTYIKYNKEGFFVSNSLFTIESKMEDRSISKKCK
jgi:hypothetical protein